MRDDDASDDAEPNFLDKLEAVFGFPLDFRERISRGQKIRIQGIRAVRRNGEIAHLVRRLERSLRAPMSRSP